MEIRETVNSIIEKIKSLKSHPSDYPELLWVIFVFLGGSINAMAIMNFVNWLNYPITPINLVEVIILTIVFGAILFLTPILFSWFFSRNHPEKRLVPPLYIQMVSFGLLVFFVYNKLPTDFASIYLVGIYTFGAGLFQNGVMIYSLGRTASSDNIITNSFTVHADIEEVKNIVLTKQFRNLFGLKRKILDKDTTLKLRTAKKRDWQIILEIKKAGKKEETVMNFAFYDEGAYSLKKIEKTDDSYWYARNKIDHIRTYFSCRYEIKIEDAPIENAEPLVTYLLDDFQGKLTQLQEMTTQKRVSLLVAIIATVAGIGLIVINRLGEGIGTLAIAVTAFYNVLSGR